jgi:dipeptidyl aminopeptidase/acylaminoacyl peptidase
MKNHLIMLVLVISLFSCVPWTPIPANTPAPTLELATPTPSVTPTMQITQSMVTSTLPSKFYKYKKICVPINTELSSDITSSGGIILGDASMPSPVVVDMSTKQEMNLGKNQYEFSVSPDKKWVAYFEGDKSPNLVVKNFSMNATSEPVLLGKDWWNWRVLGWVNDEQIMLSHENTGEWPPQLVTINPFTKSKTDLPSSFPDQLIFDSSGTPLLGAAYDLSTNYVVYIKSEGDSSGLALFNRSTGKQIAFFPSLLPPAAITSPQWNSDGTKFIFNSSSSKENKDELYLGRVDGEAEQLTQLSDEIAFYDIGNLVWSPNDRYIAFVAYDSEIGNELMLLDMINKEILDICINAKPGHFQDIVWSPDGTQLLITNQLSDNIQMFLVDLSKMQGGILPIRGTYIFGWISLQP